MGYILYVFSLLRALGRDVSRLWGLRAAVISPFSGVSLLGDFFSIILFNCFLVVLRVGPRIQRAIVFITVITTVIDMDVTITLHWTHLPIGT